MKNLPLDLRIWRATYGMSQRKAADTIGVHVNTYSRWERGVTVPEDEYLEAVRHCLAHLPPGWQRVDDGAPA
jgi:transcriptional regulator with XRE-family HTH domain